MANGDIGGGNAEGFTPNDIAPEPSKPLALLPAAFAEKCLVRFDADVPPSLNGAPIIDRLPIARNRRPRPAGVSGPGRIVLAPDPLSLAQRVLEAEFARLARTPADDADDLRVFALCAPHLDCPVAVDAAVRYLAHGARADVVVLDAEDLANGADGVLGDGESVGRPACACSWRRRLCEDALGTV